MDFFKNLHAFQRRAAIHNLAPSDRLVYLNILIKADLEHKEDIEMSLSDLTFFTGLPKTTVQDAKARLKRNGIIDFKRQQITVVQLSEEKSNIEAQRNTPTPPKKKTNQSIQDCHKQAGAREKKLVLRITRPPVEWK